MSMIVITLIVSFVLEGAFTNIISNNSLFVPMFTVTALTILYPYFNNKQPKFMLAATICGFFYDIIYTDSLFVNTFSFLSASIAIIIIYNYINMNWININVLNVIIVILFKVVSYMILCMVGYMYFKSNVLIEGIYHSIIANIVYGILLYVVTDRIGRKLSLRKME